MPRRPCRIIPFLCALAALSMPVAACYADDAPAPPPQDATSSAQPATVPQKPLLVIRFNQHRVYYDHALQEAIAGAEHTKSIVNYNVVSYVPPPSNPARAQSINEQAMGNLNGVLQEIYKLGVPQIRVHASVQPAQPGMTSQEIQIFVQ